MLTAEEARKISTEESADLNAEMELIKIKGIKKEKRRIEKELRQKIYRGNKSYWGLHIYYDENRKWLESLGYKVTLIKAFDWYVEW